MNADERRLFYKKYPANLLYFVGILLIIFSPAAAFAETLTQYHEDIKVSNTLLQQLLYFDDEDSPADSEQYLRAERDTFKRVRVRLPATEKIEWQSATLETDNRWLTEKLDKLEQMSANDGKRQNILTEISERLTAIEQKLEELEIPAVEARTKDEDKQKLAEILRREEYQKPAAQEESLAQKIERKIEEWLNQLFPPTIEKPTTPGDFQAVSLVLQIILYTLILGIIGFVVYRFAPFFVKRFRGREKFEKKERVILGERLAVDETAQNLFAEAEKLARSGNLRGAIRKGYIALLCDLSDRKIIGLSQHKTNRDYLRDVRKQTDLYQNLNGLTANYERHWYGFDEADEADWENFRNGYKRAVGR